VNPPEGKETIVRQLRGILREPSENAAVNRRPLKEGAARAPDSRGACFTLFRPFPPLLNKPSERGGEGKTLNAETEQFFIGGRFAVMLYRE